VEEDDQADQAIIDLAAQLHQGRLGAPEEWIVAIGMDASYPKRQLSEFAETCCTSEGIRDGAVAVSFSRKARGFSGRSPAIWPFPIARSDGIAILSGCGTAFSASESRAGVTGDRYCRQCREKAGDAKIRQRRYRQRKRQATPVE
jgi:hypothetical protein